MFTQLAANNRWVKHIFGYKLKINAKPVLSLWLATQTRDSICYSPPDIFLEYGHELFLISQKKGTFWSWLSISLVYTETIIHLSVSEDW